MTQNPYALACEKKGKPLFIPFVVLGDPDPKRSVEIVSLLTESGADALELGFPFSDPPADGPVIQAAGNRALAAGVKIDDCFAMLKDIRAFTNIPIGLLVYFNLILQRGIEKFYRECSESGVTSVLVADLPLEHADEVISIAKKFGIAPVMLVSEVTTDERMKKIAEIAEGYLYVVSYLGVTGAQSGAKEATMRGTIERARLCTDLPLFVGFGIHTPSDVHAAMNAGADGVIVGSAIIREIPDATSIKEACQKLSAAIFA